jgi:uncharacterized RDD family membrane protein YckC
MSNPHGFPWERDEEVLKIETPEQTQISLVLADLGSRFVGLFVDLLALFVFSIVTMFLAIAAGVTLDGELDGILEGAVGAFLFLLFFLYFILFELLWNGQTPGKRMAGTRVIQDSGRGLQLTATILRNLVRMVELALPILMLVPFFTRGRRRLGDLLAGTYVVRVIKDVPKIRSKSLLRPALPDEGPRQFTFGEKQRKLLFEDDMDLLAFLEESLANKRYSERTQAMRSVAERYVLRLSMEERREDVQRQPERFLRELGLELRKKFEDRAF